MKRCENCGADLGGSAACLNCSEETANEADAIDASHSDTQHQWMNNSPVIRVIGGTLRFVGMFVIVVALIRGCIDGLLGAADFGSGGSFPLLLFLLGLALHFGGKKLMPSGSVGTAASTGGAIVGTIVAIGLVVAFVGMLIYALSKMVGAFA